MKIRGFRVEPGEIETVLRRHPAVKDSVVVVLPDLGGEKRLVTYFITKNGGELPMQEVREFLRQRLPEYMLPTFVLQIEELPLTPSGKINRRALPDPDFGARQVEHEFVAPRTPTEEALVEIYKEVLTIDEVGIHDSFFELGGHSLLATRLVARVREDYGVNLSVRLIFEAPTVAELSLEVIKLEAEQAGGDFTAELLKDIEQMSKPQTDAVV